MGGGRGVYRRKRKGGRGVRRKGRGGGRGEGGKEEEEEGEE